MQPTLGAADAPVATAVAPAGGAGWLLGRRFDLALSLGTAALGLAIGGLVAWLPGLFAVALFADLWLLAYPHVASTFTRLVCDRETFARRRALVLVVPFVALAASLGLARAGGLGLLTGVYYHWQLFHYARQAYGIDRFYARRAPHAAPALDDALARWTLTLVPLAGLLRRAHQQPARFVGQPIAFVYVPAWAVALVGAAAAVVALWWAARQLLAPRATRMPRARVLHLASSAAVLAVGYVALEDISLGWLVANVWHNGQYLLFVWLFNHGRFRGAADARAPWLSTVSQTTQWPRYALALLAASTMAYFAVGASARLAGVAPAAMLVVYHAFNFHHYVVDAVVWRAPRAARARDAQQ